MLWQNLLNFQFMHQINIFATILMLKSILKMANFGYKRISIWQHFLFSLEYQHFFFEKFLIWNDWVNPIVSATILLLCSFWIQVFILFSKTLGQIFNTNCFFFIAPNTIIIHFVKLQTFLFLYKYLIWSFESAVVFPCRFNMKSIIFQILDYIAGVKDNLIKM